MGKSRLEAFSDGMMSIFITIMVLEMKVPHGDTMASLQPLIPVFLSYVLSFLYLGIYWNNHHHLLHTAHTVSGAVLWANLHLMFWLSLLPFTTGWMGENHFTALPTFAYGLVLIMAAVAYRILQALILRDEGARSKLRDALGKDWKGKASLILYAMGMMLSYWSNWFALAMYVSVALMWLVPDKRIERIYHDKRQ
jgi:uncharacterized membrane protein